MDNTDLDRRITNRTMYELAPWQRRVLEGEQLVLGGPEWEYAQRVAARRTRAEIAMALALVDEHQASAAKPSNYQGRLTPKG